jgi:hypothetical protein
MSSARDPSANGRLRSSAPAGHFLYHLVAQLTLCLGSVARRSDARVRR